MRNKEDLYKIIGASNHCIDEREKNDYYATPPKAVKELLKLEKFSNNILEPCCGEGYISKVLLDYGYNVISYDIIDRGFGEIKDFLSDNFIYDADIITNPPYSQAQLFIEKALKSVSVGHKVAMYLKIQFLEGKKRKQFFIDNPPKYVYVSSSRLNCGKEGKFTDIDENGDPYSGGVVCFAWYIWEKGYNGDTILRWFN